MNILIDNATVIPMTGSADAPFTASVGIAGNRIVFVGSAPEAIASFRRAHTPCREIDATGRALLPGLIDTHCHLSMTLQRSYADDIALMEWLHDYIWPFEARQTADDIALGAELGIAELLLGGVTSFVDMYWHEATVARCVERRGMRALLCPSCLDTNFEAFERDLEALLPLTSPTGRIRAGVSPHSGYTVSAENLKRCHELARRHDLRMTTHIAETPDETQILRQRTGMSPVAYFDSLGLLDERMIAAHCVHVDEKDIRTLVERGVHVAHNPTSNMKISSGTAPVEAMRQAGAAVTIGTDGACSNNDLDMWEEMRCASFQQKLVTMNPTAVPAYSILEMATVAGARALGYGDELGVIRPGALADVILVDLQRPHLQPVNDLLSNLVYCGKASDVSHVIVDGELLVDERTLPGFDLPTLYGEVAEAVKRIKQD